MTEASASVVRDGTRAGDIRDALRARTAGSAEINASGTEVLAMEVVPTVDMPHPIYIAAAEGARMTDVDGNEYIDLTMGFGPHVLGHRPRVVEEAIARQTREGWHFGIHNPLQERLARLIREAAPSVERLVFCNSGTEATMDALRVARAFSGRERVALFDGAYHGVHDYALVKAHKKSPRARPEPWLLGKGVPQSIKGNMLVLPYRDEAAYDLVREHKDELALVLIEPVQSSNPRLDTREFLHGLAEVCRACGVLFMLDEVITGFRLAYGGGQEYFGLAPDLATYGKAIGGGLPVGAVGGRAEIMELFGGRGERGGIFAGGTFSGNPLTMAAGLAALGHMRENPGIYDHMMRQGDRFAGEVNRFCRERQIPAQVMNAGSMFHLRFQGGAIESSRDVTEENRTAEREFYLHLLGHGVIVPGIHLAFFSAAHTAADVDEVIAAFKESFLDVREDGLI